MPLNRERARELLEGFKFQSLFIEEMGWGSAPDGQVYPIGDTGYMRRLIASMSGVSIVEVFPAAPDGSLPDSQTCETIHRAIEQLSHENVLIFVDAASERQRSKSVMYWVKRDNGKRRPRRHPYFRGQSGDLIMSQIDGMVIEMDELREDGSISISAVTGKLSSALDIERVTKRFYEDFSGLRLEFIELIQGIPDDAERAWYASVLLNRLMFIYFLQKKSFIQGRLNYLDDKLKESQARGKDLYYSQFLEALFFEGFAKPAGKRSPEARELLGEIPYLNGGLFLRHRLEQDYGAIHIPDRAFANVLRLFRHYSWHLDDTPGARDNEINPDVLGYIFEKYINQKAFGAYYTRREITKYLCERSIHSVLLARVNEYSGSDFKSWGAVLERLDAPLCRRLLFDILPEISILDPACGSGAFLVAAMKNLLNAYGAVYGHIMLSDYAELRRHLEANQRKHPSLHYYIRKSIITKNLYGVDIMDEAAEIAKLRLFLSLVSAAQTLEDLEPLPNIDFNIMAGNSLIGLLEVDAKRFDRVRDMADMRQQDIWQPSKVEKYRRALDKKNHFVKLYRDHAAHSDLAGASLGAPAAHSLQALRRRINQERQAAQATLNEILLDDFHALKIQYEQPQLKGRPIKRPLEADDIAALKPFHWGYEFDQIIELRGGFDVIITNPPWEVFQTDEKEFFQQFDSTIQKKKLKITDWKKQRKQLMQDPEIAAAWLKYASGFPHVSRYIKATPQYRNQISRMNGRIVSRKINLYAVFTEQCFNLLRDGGACGIVIPSGIYSDLGTKQLRQMLFDETQIDGLFGFENRKGVFEGVHRSFKFIVLSFQRGRQTASFPAAFMRHDAKDLEHFPNDDTIEIAVDLVKKSSPALLSITEFKNTRDLHIAEKMLKFPLLGDEIPGKWAVTFRQELNMTSDSHLFHTEPGEGRLPLYEGKMIWQFEHGYAEPRYWIDEVAGRKRVLGKRGVDTGQTLDYQMYRLAHRSIARSTDTRTLVASVLPRTFAGNSLNVWIGLESRALLVCVSAVNSFLVDWLLRLSVAANINMFYLYQLPVPRLTATHPFFAPIVERAAKLICTAPAYDDLAAEVGLGSHRNGVTDPAERARLRAELDGMIAHIYGLTHDEFDYVLASFPLVDAAVKAAALRAYDDVAAGAGWL